MREILFVRSVRDGDRVRPRTRGSPQDRTQRVDERMVVVHGRNVMLAGKVYRNSLQLGAVRGCGG